MRLRDKVAIVTGGGSGLGKAIAELFAHEGASVVVADLDEEAGRRVATDIGEAGGRALPYAVDVARAEQVELMVEDGVREYGKLDIIVNNAGIGGGDVIEAFDEEVWEQVLGVNLTGVLYGCKYAWPHLKKTRGVIVNMSSVAGLRGVPGFAAYGASKAGVLQLTRVAAREGAQYGIRANAICPTFIQTPMVASYLQGFVDPEATRKRLIAGIPLGRLGHPKDVAYAALFLASDEASFITGIVLPVDGGATA